MLEWIFSFPSLAVLILLIGSQLLVYEITGPIQKLDARLGEIAGLMRELLELEAAREQVKPRREADF